MTPTPLRATIRFALLASTLLTVTDFACAQETPSNWPMMPSELERRFAEDTFSIREVKSAGGGVTGASRLKLEYADGVHLKVKWKAVPNKSADGWNNSPRKELATYVIQRWFLDEADYCVPTAIPRCIPLEDYSPINPTVKPSLSDSRCVLGILAVWLEEVTVPEVFWDPKRFASDPLYARYMADFNLLTYLVDHRDGRRGNLLLSTVPGAPRVFAVDNGIAFDPLPWNFLVPNWDKIRVPWLRKESIARLRRVTRLDLNDLGVVAELRSDDNGVYQVHPPGQNMDEDEGARVKRGRVQFGLTEEEIEDLEERIEDLLEDIDDGKIEVR